MKKENPYEIVLYYIYTEIKDPEVLRASQRALCEKLNLKGRIIISCEGINGTVGGFKEDTQAYVEACAEDKLLKEMQFKRSEGLGDAFPKLSIKVRDELVGAKLGDEDINPNTVTGAHLSPDILHTWFQNKKDFVIVDMRNSYEFRLGHFKNSIDPGMRRFDELKKKVQELENLKNKTVLTVCTGGVRCEKASGYLIKKGFKDVYQLDGGILSYMEKYPGQNYDGSLFVFDSRKIMHFNKDQHTPIALCDFCSSTTERFTNCLNSKCNKKQIVCYNCCDHEEKRLCHDCVKKLVTV